MEETIKRKLGQVRLYLGYLRKLGQTTFDKFSKDFLVRGALERYLHLAIEAVIDIGNGIISSLQLKRPDRYRDIPAILREADILPDKLA